MCAMFSGPKNPKNDVEICLFRGRFKISCFSKSQKNFFLLKISVIKFNQNLNKFCYIYFFWIAEGEF